jgi:hypothetical protein
MNLFKTQALKFKSMAAVAMACVITLHATAAEPGITLRELPPLPAIHRT